MAFSLAENLFWTDILTEHAKFFMMLMPGPELEKHRSRAEEFQKTFAERFSGTKNAQLTRDNYVAWNREVIDAVKPFIDWKHEMRDAQASGKLRSLVWSTFFDHTAREAERFIARLDQYNRGSTELEKGEVIKFWSGIMGEHADFIAHLLDPKEAMLVKKSLKTAEAFYEIRDRGDSKHEMKKAADEILDFKTVAEKGIKSGAVKSIIDPTLADHVRREAVRCVDELKRLGGELESK